MTKELITRLRDDIDGKTHDDIATYEFSVEGQDYEIELGSKNYREFIVYMQYYTSRARPVKHKRKSPKKRPPEATAHQRARAAEVTKALAVTDPETRRKIRAWGTAHGYRVGDKGIIPAALQEAYRKAHHHEETNGRQPHDTHTH